MASAVDRTVNPQNLKEPPYHPWIHDLEHEVEPWIPYEEQSWVQPGGTLEPHRTELDSASGESGESGKSEETAARPVHAPGDLTAEG